ncbi:MAG: sigma-70 family RNA polymerase sigma factor [Clostridia bacterium]|nr:sigma-70 family RNA polymerase sigma factor [Clostridia bacterium]
MVDERKLLFQLQKRAKNSIDVAIDIYTPYLSTVLYNIAGNSLPKEDIEEIVSDVFIALWNNAGNIDLDKGTLRSYIATCARNFALKRLNKVKEFAELDDIELADSRDFAEDSIKSDFVWKSVMELGEPDNEIFVRYYKFGEKIKEISNATGLNVSTIKSKLSRGKRKLRILLNAEEWL